MRRPQLTFENIRHIPRLQKLFDSYHLRPTYLVSYPVATSKIGRKVLKPIAQSGHAEFGSHMHVWTTPPLVPVTSRDWKYRPLATEISYELLLSKMVNITRVVSELSGTRTVSHRAGALCVRSKGAASLAGTQVPRGHVRNTAHDLV